MSNYPLGVYDCGKCGEVAGPGHYCEPESFFTFEIYYSKDGGLTWFLCEEHDNKDRALEVADELIEDGFQSQVVDSGNNIIFCSVDKKEVA